MVKNPIYTVPIETLARVLMILNVAFAANPSKAADLPQATVIPVVFTSSIKAGKAKSGDPVSAKTMQIINLPDGNNIPKGSILIGHVQDSRKFVFDPTPYATQKPSVISVRFDKIVMKGKFIPLSVSVRALANTLEARDAASPRHLDETDSVGTNMQIGGDTFSPLETEVRSSDGNVVGYNRKQGVFAKLLPNEYSSRYASFHCDGTESEQSVAVFSASACGLYGFDSVYMPENGTTTNGSFALASRRHNVTLYAGSSALVQVISMQSLKEHVADTSVTPRN
jgi:hypothetical protein